MADFQFLLQDKNVTKLDERETVCDNPDHVHTGKIVSIAVDIGGHRFDITQDGKSYHIEGEGCLEKTECTRTQVLEYIDDYLNAQ